MDKDKLTALARRFLAGEATEAEQRELHNWYDDWVDEEETVYTPEPLSAEEVRVRVLAGLKEKLTGEFRPEVMSGGVSPTEGIITSEQAGAQMEVFVGEEIGMHGAAAEERKTRVLSLSRRRRYRWLAAASLAGLLLFSGVLYWRLRKPSMAPVAITPAAADISAPDGTRTTLILAGGRQVILDSVGKGKLAEEGGSTISKQGNNGLSYQQAGAAPSGTPAYNTLNTARGGQTEVTLADGTKVWLNAVSSLRFPAAFAGGRRVVELSGEGYFEVAPDKGRPFFVKVGGMEVQVLGTHFNINAYTDEKTRDISLLEGSIRVSENNQSILLRPGQQARAGERLEVKDEIDADEVLAWKNGWFQFNGLDIQSIMRQVCRWYDVEVVYAGDPPAGHFSGFVNRAGKISGVLNILFQAGIHYTIEGHTITLQP